MKLKKQQKNVDREKLIYETDKYTYRFKNFQTKAFGRDIYEGKITIKEADEYQADLLIEIINFRKKTKPRSQERKREKKLFIKTCIIFLRVGKEFLMLSKAKYFR